MFSSSNLKDNKMISKNHKCLEIAPFCGFNFKRGFTLIELLAALVVLAIIALIVYPTIGKVLANNKTKAYEKQIDIVKKAAANWLTTNEDKLKDNSYALPINDIVGSEFIEENELINPINNEPPTGCVFITWRKNIKQYEYNYVENCEEFIVPKLSSLKASSSENEHGWRNKDFYVSLSGEYLENYYYCIDNKKCEPNIMVTDVNKTIAFNEEGIKYVCAYGINKSGETESICEKYKLDKTKPVIGTITFDGTRGENDWYISNVNVVTTKSKDNLSGILSDELSPSKTLITKDTKGTTYTLTAKDKAGNESSVSYNVKVDKTAPTVGELVINETKGENDWYTSDVILSVKNGSDATSGHSVTTSNISKITSNTNGKKVIVTTKDNAGNISTKPYTIKVDKTAPTLTPKASNFDLIVGVNNNTSTYFNTPIYSISGGSTICTPSTTGSLNVGTHTVYCTATGGNGLKTQASTKINVKYPTFIVTLDNQGGTGGTSSVTATKNSPMPTITIPTKTCYDFNGYYTSTNNSGIQYYTASGTSFRNYDKDYNITLYAKWKENLGTFLGYTYENGNCGDRYKKYSCGKEVYDGYESCGPPAPSCYIVMSPTEFAYRESTNLTLEAHCNVAASSLTTRRWEGLKANNGHSDNIAGNVVGAPSGAIIGTTNGYQGWNTITFTACNETACDTSSVDYYVRN